MHAITSQCIQLYYIPRSDCVRDRGVLGVSTQSGTEVPFVSSVLTSFIKDLEYAGHNQMGSASN